MYAVKIMFMSGPDDGSEIWLKSNQSHGQAEGDGCTFILGRRQGCDLPIPFDTQVSREHAYLFVRGNQIMLSDAGSRNGTFIGAQRLTEPTALNLGVLFRIGYTWLRLEEID